MEKDSTKHRKKNNNVLSSQEIKSKGKKNEIPLSFTQPNTPKGTSTFYSSYSEDKYDSPRITESSLNPKTFKGIPNIVDNSIKYLRDTLILNTLYQRSIDQWDNEDIYSLNFVQNIPALKQLLSTSNNPKTILQFNYQNFINNKLSIFESQRVIHYISQLRMIPNIFKHLTSLTYFDTADIKYVFNLLHRYKNGNSINLYQEANPFIVIILLKYFFLSLPQSFFCDKLIIELLSLINSSSSIGSEISSTSNRGIQCYSCSSEHTKSSDETTNSYDATGPNALPTKKGYKEKEIKMVLKQYLDIEEQLIFQEIIELIIDIKEVYGNEEGNYCAKFFFDCFSPEYSFEEPIYSLIPSLYTKHKYEPLFLFDSEDSYIGEITKCIFDNVRCPLSVLNEPLTCQEVTIPGKLAITNYRIIFIPSVNLDVQRKAILGRFSQCPLNNIIEKKMIEVEGHSIEYAMRIITTNYSILTFFSYDNIFKIIGKVIDEVINEGIHCIFVNSNLKYPVNNTTDWKNRIKRYHWETFKINENNDKLPINAPLIETNIKCSEKNREVYICYHIINTGANLYRLTIPFIKNLKNEITIDIINDEKIKCVEVNISDLETFDKTFNDILNNLSNNKDSLNYRIFIEKIGKVNTFVTHFLLICEEIISLLNRSKGVLLIPKNLKENEVGLFSGFIEIILDPYFRTFNGFIEMIHCEFSSLHFDFEIQRNSFCFFFVCLFLLYKTYPTQFEFNESLLHFIFYHYNSRVFKDFNQNDMSSLQSYIQSHLNDFKNEFYESTLEVIPLQCIKVHFCNEIFCQVQTYNPQTVAKLLQNCRTGDLNLQEMNLFFFPIHPSFPVLNGITKLDLSNNKINDFPTEIGKLTGLIELNLSQNKLIILNDIVSKLTLLTLLNVANNNLSSIPKSITTLNIINLDISNNDLQRLSSVSFPSSIQRLSLRSNFFSSSISNLQLTYLDISETHGLEQGDFALSLPKSLVELVLNKCFIEHLPLSISKLTNLERLDLSMNEISNLHPSFFTMTQLKQLNLKKNPIPQISIMFTRLVCLTNLLIDDIVSIPSVMKDRFPNRVIKEKLIKKVNDEEFQVFLTGDISKSEILSLLAKKSGKEIDGRSFLLEKNIIVSDIPCEVIEENPFLILKNSVFVICKRVTKAKTNAVPFSRLLSFFSFIRLKQPIICVSVRVNEETLLKQDDSIQENLKTTYPELKVSFTYFDINGKDKQIKDFLKVIKNATEQCKINISPLTNKVIDELKYIDTIPGILEMDYLKMLMESLFINNSQCKSIIDTLQSLNQIFLYPETYSTKLSNYTIHILNKRPHKNHFILLSYQLPEIIYQVLSKNETSIGIQLPDFFLNAELPHLTLEQQEYILILLEYFQIIFVLRKSFFERIGLADEYEQLNRCVNNPNLMTKYTSQSMSKSTNETILSQSTRLPFNNSTNSLTTIPLKKSSSFKKHGRTPRLQLPIESLSPTSGSPFSRSPRGSRIEVTDKKQTLPKVMILNYYGLSPNMEDQLWEECKKDEVEIGRCYRYNCLPIQFCMMLYSLLSVKYAVIRGWRGGILCNIAIEESHYQLLVEWDLDKLRISFRLKIIVSGVNSFLRTKDIWQEIKILLDITMKYFPQIVSTCDVLCPHCLTKLVSVDNCYCISMDEIDETLHCGLFADTFGDHCIAFALNCWDVLVNILEMKKEPIKKEDIEILSTITHGSSSQINLCKVKGFNENVVVKEMEIDLTGMLMNGDDYVSYYIDRVEDFLRECEFLTFPESPYIAKIYGYCLNPLSIVMEYFNGGSLFQYISKNHNIPWKERIQIAISIAKGMTVFTSQKCPVVHRDLKSPNVILKINKEGKITQVAITDFGQSIPTFAENFKSCHCVECLYWLAPEVIETSTFELESDVYSYGMILWELSTLSAPFPQFHFMEEVRSFILSGNLLEIPPSPYPEFDSIIADCWKVAKARPSFAALVVKLTKIYKQM
ncbi:leucine rich repeat containing protein [Entamoeba histolytica HM-1:IMSS-B]|uniref:Protein kinase domain containing protein n=5 Tax=Entamoeba histolytica TaxID=5759 RepID=C4M164_ENTH1|nr:protein kinase domain containing protein [Entamoeba histolytica HM-1:IMSS]EMH73082.1 leucine rich repeat containing protein [Entamoeba histolytica HM-1:IMSS-B]EMS14691.1 serine-threonine protein kinase, putative [Entamoeba histolytica HM-3:IMSS]ENY63112.1 serine-threonine protein kinase, putative [Entamoeba histolytica HM-1:IMSS-A]GAT94937.1 hypothetical protein CL6EHI_107230 [Entamoeba histolytica]EAL47388.1 protein kinase domain containing protein [Entamoeba histolytica HM-1:IMSS]|eukprot:XP_652774.1 protein kinase domain containing protein [Entamoeba histolytica HM-1:IMSS]